MPAPKMLNELHAAEIHGALDRVLRRYVRADLLVIGERRSYRSAIKVKSTSTSSALC